MPADFGVLPQLQFLILADNSLSGNIPPSLGGSSTLKVVDLGRNSFTGGIPESLANSSSLQVLRLMSNSLSENLPEVLFNSSSLTTVCLQQNFFVGSIPPVTAIKAPVKYLSLKENRLSGPIPLSLGNLSSLIYISLEHNNLVGTIPESLSQIPAIETLRLHMNNLSGHVPPSLFNMSSLRFLGLGNNTLIGRLPFDIGYTLPNIQTLVLTSNRFHGIIPPSLLNLSHLEYLHIADNRLSGFMPFFGSLPSLKALDVSHNMLESGDWGFLSSLSNCTQLIRLKLGSNNLQGSLPRSIGNLSNSLERLDLRVGKIFGQIPLEIGNLKNLTVLLLDYNLLSGRIPPTMMNLHNLVVLTVANNKFYGPIPETIGSLINLDELHLDGNNLSGSIPASIGQCRKLHSLNLSHNSLVGSIPSELFKVSSFSSYLDLSHNYLSGGIPEEAGNLINLGILSISNNKLSGKIPSGLGHCAVLEFLHIQSNFLEGSIPQSFVDLVGMKDMDLSQNNLSGQIPEFLASLKHLNVLNLSFNNFDGVVPTGGVFGNDGAVVAMQGNGGLCTSIPVSGLPVCPIMVDFKRKKKSLLPKILLPVVTIVLITLACLVTILKRKRKQAMPHQGQANQDIKNITYQDIVRATDQLSSANIIGSGSFGTVYKGRLEDNLVAIKIFNLEIFGANNSFVAECATLKTIRHRNLVKIINLCSSVDLTGNEFKALVFKYMPNGNLETWLHSKVHEQGQRKIMNLSQRVNIALDIAVALDYLHTQCAYPIIHCDLKPSNVLLDLDMTARIGDFGLARFLSTRSSAQHNSSASLAHLRGSIGYIAPEYGMSVEISTKGDIYSFGVLLLEMITGRRPTDEKFSDGSTIHEFVYSAFPNNIYEIVDPIMLEEDMNATDVIQHCIVPFIQIGLSCSMTLPKVRWDMGKVCIEILTVKRALSNIYNIRQSSFMVTDGC